MTSNVEELLKQCTVCILDGSGRRIGTGFFVSPSLVLTCSHVVRISSNKGIAVRLSSSQEEYRAKPIFRNVKNNKTARDIALLRLDNSSIKHQCVPLEKSRKLYASGTLLHIYGYPENYPDGCPVTVESEGETGGNSPFIKFKNGEISSGISGAPVLNKDHGKVVGMTKRSRQVRTPSGGDAIPMSEILNEIRHTSEYKEITDFQKVFFRDSSWEKAVNYSQRLSKWELFGLSVFSLLLTVFAVFAFNSTSWSERAQLAFLDYFVNVKLNINPEQEDERIKIIAIDDKDIDWLAHQKESGESSEIISFDSDNIISDKILLELLEKINGQVEYQPSVIGLDIFRDKPQPQSNPKGHEKLLKYIEENNVISICYVSAPLKEESGGSIPKDINHSQESSGFSDSYINNFVSSSDVEVDEGSNRIRRQVLFSESSKECGGQEVIDSFNFKLAFHYLASSLGNSFEVDSWEDKIVLKWEDKPTSIQYLSPHQSGGYLNKMNRFEAQQILINYRAYKQDHESIPVVGKTFSLRDILEDKESLSQLKNKIVIIGYTAHNHTSGSLRKMEAHDFHRTPYFHQNNADTLMPGVYIQAHMASQITSAVLDGRPLLRATSTTLNSCMLTALALLGICLIGHHRQSLKKNEFTFLTASFCVSILALISSYALFLNGLWIPILPCLISFWLSQCIFRLSSFYWKIKIHSKTTIGNHRTA